MKTKPYAFSVLSQKTINEVLRYREENGWTLREIANHFKIKYHEVQWILDYNNLNDKKQKLYNKEKSTQAYNTKIAETMRRWLNDKKLDDMGGLLDQLEQNVKQEVEVPSFNAGKTQKELSILDLLTEKQETIEKLIKSNEKKIRKIKFNLRRKKRLKELRLILLTKRNLLEDLYYSIGLTV